MVYTDINTSQVNKMEINCYWQPTDFNWSKNTFQRNRVVKTPVITCCTICKTDLIELLYVKNRGIFIDAFINKDVFCYAIYRQSLMRAREVFKALRYTKNCTRYKGLM